MKPLGSFTLFAIAGAALAQAFEYRKVNPYPAIYARGGDVCDGWKYHKKVGRKGKHDPRR